MSLNYASATQYGEKLAQNYELTCAVASMEFLRSSIFPEGTPVAAPQLHERLNMMMPVRVNGIFRTESDIINQNYSVEVSTSRGMLAWLTQRGCLTLSRFGYVPRGTIIEQLKSTTPNFYRIQTWFVDIAIRNGFISANNVPGPEFNEDPSAYAHQVYYPGDFGVGSLYWSKELTLPYADVDYVGKNNVLTFSPNLPADFSAGRLVSGIVSVSCNTVSLNAGTIAGSMAMAVVPDTRDVCQSTAGFAFDPTLMTTMSITAKDGKTRFDAELGATMIQGPDMSAGFAATDADTVTTKNSENEIKPLPDILIANAWVGQQANMQACQPMARVWASPWGIQASTLGALKESTDLVFAAQVPSIQNIAIGKIDEFGTVDCTVRWTPYVYSSSDIVSPDDARAYVFRVSAEAIYGRVVDATQDVPYNITFRTETIFSDINIQAVPTQNGPMIQVPVPIVSRFDFTSLARSRPYNQQGKLLGIYFNFLCFYNNPMGGTTPTNSDTTLQAENVSIEFEATTLGKQGYVGPAHITSWSNIPVGQDVVVEGVLNCQVVPNGNTVQFTKDSIQQTMRAADVNTLPFIASIFNSQRTPLMRNWITTTEYRPFLRRYATNITPADIVQWANGDPQVIAATAAAGFQAGFWGDLWGDIKKGAQWVGNEVVGLGKTLASDAASAVTSSAKNWAKDALMASGSASSGGSNSVAMLRNIPQQMRLT